MKVKKFLGRSDFIRSSYGFHRYLNFRLKVLLHDLRDMSIRTDSCCPVPPARLRHRVHGSLNRESFLKGGEILAGNIREMCESTGRDLYSFNDILDFGCGCGRILRNFRNAPETCRFHGTDIDPGLIEWCRKNLPGFRWNTNGHRPPMIYDDGSFDLIFAVSVFTHLNEEMQHQWLKELQRISKPEGILILTVHGEYCFGDLSSEESSMVNSKGFLYKTGATGRFKLDGLPDFYQTAYHTDKYVRNEWSSYFNIVEYCPRGINDHQDAVVLRRE